MEYALIASLLAVFVITAITMVGGQVDALWAHVSTMITTATSGGAS